MVMVQHELITIFLEVKICDIIGCRIFNPWNLLKILVILLEYIQKILIIKIQENETTLLHLRYLFLFYLPPN